MVNAAGNAKEEAPSIGPNYGASNDHSIPNSEHIVRLRGLPFNCTKNEIEQFLGEVSIAPDGIIFPHERLGSRPTGEAYVLLVDATSLTKALEKNRQNIQHRYVEVFASTRADLNRALSGVPSGNSSGGPRGGQENSSGYGGSGGAHPIPSSDYIVRLRGLPYNCTKNEIEQFLGGVSIAPDGIVFPHEQLGSRPTGEAYVFLTDPPSLARALEKNRKNIQHRYIEVFASSRTDLNRALAGNSGGDPGSWEGYSGSWAGYGGGRGGGYEDSYGYGGYGGGPMRGGMGNWRGEVPRPGPMGPRVNTPMGPGGGRPTNMRGTPYRPNEGENYDFYAPHHPGNAGDAVYGGGWGGGYEDPYGYGGYGGGPMRGGPGGVDIWGGGGPGPIGPRVGGAMGPGGGLVLKMRGIPFRASEGDIHGFFAPLRPSSIQILREASGRPSGEAKVEFSSRQEYNDALLKNKQYMGTRYVELFPDHP